MSKCCCSSENCCGRPQPKKTAAMYLDTIVCGRYQNTEKVVDEAVSSVPAALSAGGHEVEGNKMNNTKPAIQYQFLKTHFIAKTRKNDMKPQAKAGDAV